MITATMSGRRSAASGGDDGGCRLRRPGGKGDRRDHRHQNGGRHGIERRLRPALDLDEAHRGKGPAIRVM